MNKYTYKNLVEINRQIMNNKEEKGKEEIKTKKNNSWKQVNKYFDNEIRLTMNDVKKVESLNISY